MGKIIPFPKLLAQPFGLEEFQPCQECRIGLVRQLTFEIPKVQCRARH
jgi:hypothetical protein